MKIQLFIFPTPILALRVYGVRSRWITNFNIDFADKTWAYYTLKAVDGCLMGYEYSIDYVCLSLRAG